MQVSGSRYGRLANSTFQLRVMAYTETFWPLLPIWPHDIFLMSLSITQRLCSDLVRRTQCALSVVVSAIRDLHTSCRSEIRGHGQ
jgi:hypothetical protein